MSAILVTQTPRSNLNIVVRQAVIPHFSELVTQGVIAGALALFIYAIIYSFYIPNYYKPLIVGALHQFLGIGAGTGLVHGLAYWCYTRLLEGRFRQVARIVIAMVTVTVTWVVLIYAFGPSDLESLWLLGSLAISVIRVSVMTGSLTVGVVHTILYPAGQSDLGSVPLLAAWIALPLTTLSVITGSARRPWRALLYGVRRVNAHQRFPASAIGLLLRVTLLFLCFESAFLFVCVLQMNEKLMDYVVAFLAVMDFLIGIAIVLLNPRFWLTLTLAFVINAPWLFILIKYCRELSFIWPFILAYLLLWCGFLLTRLRRLDRLFSFIREELRYYYLID